MKGPLLLTCGQCKTKYDTGNANEDLVWSKWECQICGTIHPRNFEEEPQRCIPCQCAFLKNPHYCKENEGVIWVQDPYVLLRRDNTGRRSVIASTEVNLGPLSKTDGIEVTVDGITTTDNGEFLKDIPRETLDKYEKSKIKCFCKKKARLDWSRKNQYCYYHCRDGLCKYWRRFKYAYDDYLPEDNIMSIYG